MTKCSFTNTKEHLFCFSDGAEEARNLIKLDASLTKMKKAHETYTKELEKLKKVGTKQIKTRSFSAAELSKLKEKVTNITIDKDRLTNAIENLMAEVKEEMIEYGVGVVQQKIRVCDDDETVLRVSFLSVLIVAVLLAALSTVRLDKITDYEELFKR